MSKQIAAPMYLKRLPKLESFVGLLFYFKKLRHLFFQGSWKRYSLAATYSELVLGKNLIES